MYIYLYKLKYLYLLQTTILYVHKKYNNLNKKLPEVYVKFTTNSA